jgi:protocatechuate 3,4-dioxygenase beta subunit
VSRRIGFAFSGLLGLAASAWAQVPVGILGGKVVDTSPGPIARAQVELRSLVTGRQFIASTDSNGEFRFSTLKPGSYAIKVQSPGFNSKSAVIIVRERQNTEIEIRLDVGESVMGNRAH